MSLINLRKLAKAKTEEEKQSLLESIRELDKVHKSIPCKDPMDENFRRLQYVRYADDFLIGIIGAKEDAQAVKQEIGTYIAGQLKLELSDEKTLVTKATDRAKFLGFEIRVTPQSNHTKKTKSGSTARNYSGHVMLEVPTSAIQKKLLELGAMRIDVRNGTEIWQPTHRGKLVGRTDLSILDQYNGEIRGFCNYYAIANNRSKLHKFRYIMEYRHTGRTFRIPLVKTDSSRIAVPRKDMESIPSGPFTVNVFLVPEKTVEYILYIEDMEIIPVPLKLRN